jgi:acyl carrier protein
MNSFAQLQSLIATTLKVPASAITPQTRNEDVASWDSLGQVNLIMALEQSFDLEVDVEEFAELTSVSAILKYLSRQGVA